MVRSTPAVVTLERRAWSAWRRYSPGLAGNPRPVNRIGDLPGPPRQPRTRLAIRGGQGRSTRCVYWWLCVVLASAVVAIGACAPPRGQPSCGPAPAGFTHHSAVVHGARLHYVVGGHGPAVVMLHGFPETWQAFRAVLPRLASEHTVIAPDLRGIGCSSAPVSGYDKHTLARDVHELLGQVGVHRASVVGHDMGGMVAYAYARTYRDETTHLTLSGALLPGFGLEELMDSPDPAIRLAHLRTFMRPGAAQRLIVGREREFLTQFIGSPAVLRSPIFTDYVRAYARPGRADAALGQYRALETDAAQNRRAAGPPLAMPVLTLNGAASLSSPAYMSARRVARNVREVVLNGAGHYVLQERPAAFGETLLAFLREHPPPA